jgi:diaminopimelate epimerase
MHGLGNDYVYVNCFEEQVENPSALARIISNRHTGIGGDGLILIGPSRTADVRMRIFNADGSEAEMCGSGTCACCIAAVLTGRQGRLCTAHLPGGDLYLNWRQDDNCVYMTGPATEVFEGTWPES